MGGGSTSAILSLASLLEQVSGKRRLVPTIFRQSELNRVLEKVLAERESVVDVFTELNEDLFSQNQGESIKRLFTLVNVFSRVRSKRQFNMQRLKEGEHQKLMRSAYPREFEEMEI